MDAKPRVGQSNIRSVTADLTLLAATLSKDSVLTMYVRPLVDQKKNHSVADEMFVVVKLSRDLLTIV